MKFEVYVVATQIKALSVGILKMVSKVLGYGLFSRYRQFYVIPVLDRL